MFHLFIPYRSIFILIICFVGARHRPARIAPLQVHQKFIFGNVNPSSMEDTSEIVKQVLIPMFYKEAQLGRSLRRKYKEFNKALFASINRLREKADNETLKNIYPLQPRYQFRKPNCIRAKALKRVQLREFSYQLLHEPPPLLAPNTIGMSSESFEFLVIHER